VITGLLWYDNDPKVEFAAKVARAAGRYRERFGRAANVCYVHPSTLASISSLPVGLHVLPSAKVQQNCYWVGRKDL
jgi:hypothetical protein